MSDLLQKISSYNIFNYLLPGVLFVGLLPYLTTYNLTQGDLLIGAFLYYFIGMCISRIGSLIVEPILKAVSFVEFSEYSAFITASAKDPKIETLSEANNTYRTICALLLSLVAFKLYQLLEGAIPALHGLGSYVLILGLALLFFFSYRKQTAYITKRIKHNL